MVIFQDFTSAHVLLFIIRYPLVSMFATYNFENLIIFISQPQEEYYIVVNIDESKQTKQPIMAQDYRYKKYKNYFCHIYAPIIKHISGIMCYCNKINKTQTLQTKICIFYTLCNKLQTQVICRCLR